MKVELVHLVEHLSPTPEAEGVKIFIAHLVPVKENTTSQSLPITFTDYKRFSLSYNPPKDHRELSDWLNGCEEQIIAVGSDIHFETRQCYDRVIILNESGLICLGELVVACILRYTDRDKARERLYAPLFSTWPELVLRYIRPGIETFINSDYMIDSEPPTTTDFAYA